MSEFVEPSEKQRLAALQGLTDAALVGHYWRLEDLDALRDDERRRLKRYRHETFGFEEYCEGLVVRSDRGPGEVADLMAVLDRWEAAFCELRLWHQGRSIFDCERNPVAKVLIYEESRITGVRGRLGPRPAVVEQRPSIPTGRAPSAARTRAAARSEDTSGGEVSGGVVSGGASSGRESSGEADVDGLTAAILVLAEAVNRLSEVIAGNPRPRGARKPRSDRISPPSPRSAPVHGTRSR